MTLRHTNLERLQAEIFDVFIVGGGINGAATAAALATQGAAVALVDRGDFASQTSQESSNLVWGGIKYLESGELPLVRKLCVSRNHLIRSYPSTVQEVRFFTALERGFRWNRLFVFLGTLLHRGGANHSDRSRLAISNQYCQPWARQQENYTLAIPAERARQLPERVQAFLGYSIHPPFMGHVEGVHPRRLLEPT